MLRVIFALAGIRSPRRVLVLLAVLIAGGLFGYPLLIRLTMPWASPLTSGGMLTGRWSGTARMPGGRSLVLWMEMEANHARPCRRCSDMVGRAATCDEGGAFRAYKIWGSVRDRAGARSTFQVSATVEQRDRIRLGSLAGEWSGEVLRVTTRLVDPGISSWRTEWDERGVERTTPLGQHPDVAADTVWTLRREDGAWPARCPGR
ncbi:hypothetical protein [Roseomonas sp. WA12]